MLIGDGFHLSFGSAGPCLRITADEIPSVPGGELLAITWHELK